MPHELIYTQDRDVVHVVLSCTEPKGAPCRSRLGECNAESWHQMDPSLTVEFQASPQESFEIGRVAVAVQWDGEGWAWWREKREGGKG